MKKENNKMLDEKIANKLVLLFKILCILYIPSLISICVFEEGILKYIMIGLYVIINILVILIYSMDGKYLYIDKPTKADLIKDYFNDYQKVVNKFSKNTDYKSDTIKINNELSGTIFYNIKKSLAYGQTVSTIFIVDINEYSEELFKEIVNANSIWVNDNIKNYSIDSETQSTVILCMKKNNDDFMKYINIGMTINPNFTTIAIGIIPETGEIYVANSRGHSKKYDKIKTQIVNILTDIE